MQSRNSKSPSYYISEIKRILADDEHCKDYLPALDVDEENLYKLFEDGIVLAKLLMAVNPSVIRIKDLTFKKNQ